MQRPPDPRFWSPLGLRFQNILTRYPEYCSTASVDFQKSLVVSTARSLLIVELESEHRWSDLSVICKTDRALHAAVG